MDNQIRKNSDLTPEKCKAIRALLKWSQNELASISGVSRNIIAKYETKENYKISDEDKALIIKTFEIYGVGIISEGDKEMIVYTT